jgi:hypothetical protein
MAGVSITSSRGRFALAFLGALTAALMLLSLLTSGDAAAAPNGGIKADSNCAPQPTGLSPKGSGPVRFTMLIRINQQVNVDTWVNFNEASGGLGARVRPQDIFVINTRHEDSTPALATQLATNLRTAFPCNRIIALNGLGLNPAIAGYAFTLLDHPSIYALMSDFEPDDWNRGRASDPGRPAWNYNFKVAFPRIKQWDGRLAGTLASNVAGAGKRSGLVPIDNSGWNFGQIAQDLDKKNRRLGGRHLGPLSVQTQDACANGGASAFLSRTSTLFDQYRYKLIRKTVKRKGKKRKITIRRKIKKQARPDLNNLSLQISFSNTPNPNSSMAITKTSAKTAAACTRAALKRGGGAFFYFASPDSMRVLFNQPEIGSLRPTAAAAKKKKKK